MDNKQVTGNTIANNMIWRLMERFGAQGVTTIVSIVLARLLDPAVYGVVAIVSIFTALLQVFIDSGFANALIQKKDADDLDFSTVFYFNVVVCIVLYLGLFAAAPLIAKFYKMAQLTAVVRVQGLTLIISGLKNVQQAFVSKNLMFKKFFFATLTGTIGAAVVGIVMALLGFGVWAIVTETLFNMTVDTMFLWFTVKWRPKKMFSWARLKGMFSFGSKLFMTSIFATIYREARQMIIGKVYTAEDLAFYNKGATFPQMFSNNVISSIDSVIFPVLAIKQNDLTDVKSTTRRAVKLGFYIVSPMMAGLCACATPFITVLLTAKWLPCVFFMRICCYSYAWDCITQIHINATKSLGKGQTLLRIDIIKKVVTFTVMLATVFINLEVMMWSMLGTALFAYVISAYPNTKLFGYSFKEQFADLFPIAVLDIIMIFIVLSVQLLGLGAFLTLIIQVIVGAVTYIVGSKLFKLDSFDYLRDFCKAKLGNHLIK